LDVAERRLASAIYGHSARFRPFSWFLVLLLFTLAASLFLLEKEARLSQVRKQGRIRTHRCCGLANAKTWMFLLCDKKSQETRSDDRTKKKKRTRVTFLLRNHGISLSDPSSRRRLCDWENWVSTLAAATLSFTGRLLCDNDASKHVLLKHRSSCEPSKHQISLATVNN
jgi:hypothetical protein